jgi:hypothetical protein
MADHAEYRADIDRALANLDATTVVGGIDREELDRELNRRTYGETGCAACGAPVGALEVFPGGICVDCYAQTPAGRRMPTAAELVAMWKGPARRH